MLILQVFFLTIGSTLLTFLEPSINAFVLMTLGIPSAILLMYNLRREDDKRYYLEMGLDPTRAYFWPAVNKRLTRLFLTWPEEMFLTRRGKNWKILDFQGEIFQTQTKDGWPGPTWPTKILPDPGQNFLTWTHH